MRDFYGEYASQEFTRETSLDDIMSGLGGDDIPEYCEPTYKKKPKPARRKRTNGLDSDVVKR